MNFSEALDSIKRGGRVRRADWGGVYVAEWQISPGGLPFVYVQHENGQAVPWMATQTDLFADDWEVFNMVVCKVPTLPYTQVRVETNANLGVVTPGAVVDFGGGTFWQNATCQRVKNPHDRQDVPQVCTISNGSPAIVGCVDHRWSPGDQVCFNTNGTLPAGIKVRSKANPDWPFYYVKATGLSDDSFQVSDVPGTDGPAVNTTSAGNGEHSVQDVRNAYPIRSAVCDLTLQNAVIPCWNSMLVHGDIFAMCQVGGYYNSSAVLGLNLADNKHAVFKWLRIGGTGGVGGDFGCWDGIRVGGVNTGTQLPGEYHHLVEQVWISDCRDDGIENDGYSSVTVSHSLIENVYYAFSARGSMTHPRLGDRWEINDSLISFRGSPNARECDAPCTFSSGSTTIVTCKNHRFKIGEQVKFAARTPGGYLPAGIEGAPYGMYYVISEGFTPNSFMFSETRDGPPVKVLGPGSGMFDVRLFTLSIGGIYKFYKGYSPPMNIRRSIIAIPTWDVRWDAYYNLKMFWSDLLDKAEDNYFLYFGKDDADFGEIPPGFTYLNGDAARATWEAARSEFIDRHPKVPLLN